MGKPKRCGVAFDIFKPNTVRRYKRRERKKDEQELREFYDVKEWECF